MCSCFFPILGGLTSFIYDLDAFEQTEMVSHPHDYLPTGQSQHDTVSTVISSTSDTHSCYSASSTSYPSIGEITSDSQQHESDVSFSEKSPFVNPPSCKKITSCSFPYIHWPRSMFLLLCISYFVGSLHGLVNTAMNTVSHKLLTVWKADLNTSLAAVEMLGAMAKISIPEQSTCGVYTPYSLHELPFRISFVGIAESRRVVRVLCEYISQQCSRPPPAHSKDLHSTIVAAFMCVASWLFAHPYLITDNADCLHAVLQVVELGISGSKSQVWEVFVCVCLNPTFHKLILFCTYRGK